MATRDRGATPKSEAGADTGRPLRRLVIVESPTKARKIAPYLGHGYVVEASVGHIRDLPAKAAEVPAEYTGAARRLGVDVDHDFKPIYIVNSDKRTKVSELKSLLKDADELYLATDPDREGEAIAWHLLETLKPKVPVRRMVFHEITESAIRAAAADTRELDNDLVDAQETRRILDRLVGYEVSPVLWKKVMRNLSAGRVQSVAVRMIVQRERERMAFRSAEYWDIAAKFDAETGAAGADAANPRTFGARLVNLDGARVASGRDFGSDGQLKTANGVVVLDEGHARRLADALEGADFQVSSVESKPYTRKPYAPFMTSTLQQEAARKLRFTSERTMSVAQRLYENGYITYMRTDSTTLSESAIAAARAQATQLYGTEYVSPTPRQYNRKVKNAQEAHEAIRPSGDTFTTPGQLHARLDQDEFRLYELIWQRTVASQMADARGTTMTVRITGRAGTGEQCVFSTSGRTITFPGFLKAYVESVDEESGGQSDDAESRLPALTEGQGVAAAELTPDGHSTNPPARYTEASLVKAMEELGIGRPSTYASIINTITKERGRERGYVYKRGSALVPSWVSFAVIGLLEAYFGRLVDLDFTAAMEDDLDAIAGGREQRGNWLSSFYFGGDHGAEASVARSGGLKKMVDGQMDDIDARSVNSIRLFADDEGRDVVVRVGKFGPYLERMVINPDDPDGELISQRANLLDELAPDELTLEVAEKLFATPQEGRTLGVDPETGHRIVAKEGRFGPYVTEVLPKSPDEDEPKKGAKKAEAPKARTGSLFKFMDPATVTLAEALQLLSLPRVVGNDPESGEEITAQNGRYGPYLKKGNDSRSLATEDQLFTVTLDEALKLYAEPKRRGRQAASTAPLRELGNDSATGKPMVIKDGRFGPYVTDGETNASLRKGDEVESITDERASELLADRRAKAPVKKAAKKTAKKTAAKKTTAAKATATKTAAKATAKKTVAKKTVAKKTVAKKAPAKKATTTKS
ncbi:DNA topoisomerase-1 [Nocardia sp. GAS34]